MIGQMNILKGTNMIARIKNAGRLSCFCIVVIGCLVLMSSSGCGVDWSSILDDVLAGDTTDATISDLVGTWTGTITANSTALSYQFTIDSSGKFVAGDGTTGTVTVTSGGSVTFTYTTEGYTVLLKGTLNSAKTQITMTTSSWTGTSSGSTSFTGTLTKSSSTGTFYATDLVGTWSGTITENGQSQSYSWTIDSSGNFTSTNNTSGTATISSSGMVVFAYSSGGYSGTYQGIMNSSKTQIIMSTHTWTGTSSGSAAYTGTLSK